MRRSILLAVPALLLATVAALGPDGDARAVSAMLPISQPAGGNSPAVRLAWSSCLDRPNALRAAVGVGPLAIDARVAAAAIAHSEDQAQRQTMSHVGSDGSDAGLRLQVAGFRWSNWGENVAAGQAGCDSAVDAWLGSAPHRANILNAAFTTVGIGSAVGVNGVPYWTMDLAVEV